MTTDHSLHWDDPRLPAFWTPRRHASLTTLRPNGTPHTVPVAPIVDVPGRRVLVLTSGHSVKARNVAAADGSGRVTVCEIDGRHWVTAEGRGRLVADPAFVRDCEQRYARRFRVPRDNPDRVILVVEVDRLLGSLPREGVWS